MIPFVLADHSFISAAPFLFPALIIIGFLAFHVIRDRRSGDGDEAEFYDDDWAGPTADDPVDGPERDATDGPVASTDRDADATITDR